LGLTPRDLSHFSDNAGDDLSVTTRTSLRCVPNRSRRSAIPVVSSAFDRRNATLRMLSPCRATHAAPRCTSRSPFRDPIPFETSSPSRAGPAPRAVPLALVGPAGYLAVAAQVATRTLRRLPPAMGHPSPVRLSSAQAAPGRSRPRLPLAVTVRALTHRRGLSARPRRASPFGRGMATVLRTLFGYHRRNVPVDPEGSTSHLPAMTPRGWHPRRRTPLGVPS